MEQGQLTVDDINTLLKALNESLQKKDIVGEVYLVGGAVMCLALNARPSTNDVDGYFVPKEKIRDAVKEIAREKGYPENWLNDAVKGYLSERGTFGEYLNVSNLRVMTATPEYLLAMKCLSMRLGPEYHDQRDVDYLLRFLNIENYQEALQIITRFYPLEKFPQKTLYVLEEILGNQD